MLSSNCLSNPVSANRTMHFGKNDIIGGQYFNGSLDEVRISNTVRSADWIATEYNNQSSPSAFYTIGLQTAN